MQAKHKTPSLPCVPGALPGGLSRTRFFDGMLLTQLDLEREQNYLRTKRKLTNRALGTGVVWGLRLEWDEHTHCFHLGPGYALDCCGNDLVVECPQKISEQSLVDKNDPAIQAILAGQKPGNLRCPEPEQEEFPKKACIILQYAECAGDPQPVHDDACTTNVAHCEYSSIRETTRVLLVPPPSDPESTPMDAFCKRLDALKQECEELKDCTLFDKSRSLATDAFPVHIEVRNLTKDSPTVQIQPEVGEDVSVTVEASLPDASDEMQVTIKPAPGYVILDGKLTADGAVTFAPFGGEFEATGAHFLAADGPAFTITQLQVSSLLTNETNVSAGLGLSMGTAADGKKFLRVTTTNFNKLPIEETCNDKLAPWLIFNKSPECSLKTLALVALCGWFKGIIADDPEAKLSGKHVAAWWVCNLAWKVLFGANLGDQKASVLNEALKKLLEEWCAAFFYPGPYCQNAHHGVYLGCVELSRKGNILSFDPWAYRRYVITGPLLTHWGSLLGLAPIDVVAGRFASWICCLGKSSSVAVTGDIAASMIDGLPLNQFGRAIVAGDEVAVDDYMTRYNLTRVGETRTINLKQFSSRAFSDLVSDKNLLLPGASALGKLELDATLSNKRVVYAVENSGIFLLEPTSGRDFPKPVSEVEHKVIPRILEGRTATLRPLARGLVNDYAVEVTRAIELSKLKALTEDAVMTALVNEVNKHKIVTVEEYLKAGPERAVKLALANFDELDEVEEERDLYIAAEELTLASEAVLDSVVEPFVEDKIDTGGGPLMGDVLADADTAKVIGRSIRSHLKANALTNADLKVIGKRVEKHRDQWFKNLMTST